jgi:hypothetical protein
MLEILKTRWASFAQVGIWVLTVGSTFLLTPPVLSYAAASPAENLARFLIAALVALLFIPLKSKSDKANYRLWQKISIVTFIVSIGCIFGYIYLVDNSSVDYYGKRIVIGKNMLSEAAADKQATAEKLGKPFIDDATFLKTRLGEPQYIWPESELKARYYGLSLLYILTFLLLAAFLITTIQTIECYEQKKKALT